MSEYDELVKRLRITASFGVAGTHPVNQDGFAAADAIEALVGEVEKLKGALEFVDLSISKDNEVAKEAIRSALEAKP